MSLNQIKVLQLQNVLEAHDTISMELMPYLILPLPVFEELYFTCLKSKHFCLLIRRIFKVLLFRFFENYWNIFDSNPK